MLSAVKRMALGVGEAFLAVGVMWLVWMAVSSVLGLVSGTLGWFGGHLLIALVVMLVLALFFGVGLLESLILGLAVWLVTAIGSALTGSIAWLLSLAFTPIGASLVAAAGAYYGWCEFKDDRQRVSEPRQVKQDAPETFRTRSNFRSSSDRSDPIIVDAVSFRVVD